MEYRQKPFAGNWLALLPPLPRTRHNLLSLAQRQMYARESLVNFRWISRICATRSDRPLTSADRVPVETALRISEIGQFAELAYTPVPFPYVFDNIHILGREHFPLEGYDALAASNLVHFTRGKVADVQAYSAYRPSTRQLVTAFTGTANIAQCLYDLRLSQHQWHNGAVRRGRVHNGFWKMFKGLRTSIMRSLEAACTQYDIEEIVLTGHSLGGALAYLFALEVLSSSEYALPVGVKVIVTTFGAPRVGDEELATYWSELVAEYRAAHGPDAVQEYCIKGYRDGVPAIPPASLGYRHFCREPLYFMHGKLYRIPPAEREHALFDVEPGADAEPPLHPRGGHNYYNGRNMENAFRRLQFLGKIIEKRPDSWEHRYLKRVRKYEGLVLDTVRAATEPLPTRRSEGDSPFDFKRDASTSSGKSSGSESQSSAEPDKGRSHRSTASLP